MAKKRGRPPKSQWKPSEPIPVQHGVATHFTDSTGTPQTHYLSPRKGNTSRNAPPTLEPTEAATTPTPFISSLVNYASGVISKAVSAVKDSLPEVSTDKDKASINNTIVCSMNSSVVSRTTLRQISYRNLILLR